MDTLAPRSTDLERTLRHGTVAFPCQCELSLRPLIAFWMCSCSDAHSPLGALARVVRERLEATPELAAPVIDREVIERHRDLVDILMAVIFAPVFWDSAYGAIMAPFRLQSVYATPTFERLLMTEKGRLRGRINLDERAASELHLLDAYLLVLERLYGLRVQIDFPLILTITDPETGLDLHLKAGLDDRFLEVEAVGELPVLPEALRRDLAANVLDLHALRTHLPPERFRFRGFQIFRGIDVTDQEVLSALKRDLIDKESIVSTTRFQGLQARLQTLFRRPELRLSLAAIDGDRVFMLSSGSQLAHACIFADSSHHRLGDFVGSPFERAARSRQPVIITDLAAQPDRVRLEEAMVQAGIRNLLVAPLVYQDQLIGMLSLKSHRPGDLTAAQMPKLQEVLPLFSMAVQRSMEELNNRIQAFIKEQCTAIHPAVEWRFRKAVLDGIDRQRADGGAGAPEMDAIVFDEVYPLYALSDIRGSSTHRALAIQADLLAQLGLARDVLAEARAVRPLPALDELAYRLDKHATHIGQSLTSGDELTVVGFLRRDVEPLFDRLASLGSGVSGRVEAYRAALDPRLGTLYRQRHRFDESVTRINDTVAAYLDLEQQAAQGMVPHYFEKQVTDGVDYQVYAGASLLEDGRFSAFDLRNLRLWQLMVTCGIALRVHRLRDQLPVPLDATHLVLAHHAPLSIRFRLDEKRFDVDGAYNMRYAIVKKRIDKALVRGTGERLTQPGKIAVVYTQPAELAEYQDYVEYLQTLGYLTGEVELLDLDDLQGAHGLQALRVTVDLDSERIAQGLAARTLAETSRASYPRPPAD